MIQRALDGLRFSAFRRKMHYDKKISRSSDTNSRFTKASVHPGLKAHRSTYNQSVVKVNWNTVPGPVDLGKKRSGVINFLFPSRDACSGSLRYWVFVRDVSLWRVCGELLWSNLKGQLYITLCDLLFFVSRPIISIVWCIGLYKKTFWGAQYGIKWPTEKVKGP